MLVSIWKPLFLLPPLVAWAIVVSRALDKHAQRFLRTEEVAGWNIGHMVAGTLALACAVLMPIAGFGGFIVGWLAMVAILAIDIVVFVMVTNKDERVPANARLSLSMGSGEPKEKRVKAGVVSLTIKGVKGVIAAPEKETPDYQLRLAAEDVVIQAREQRASEFSLMPMRSDEYSGYVPVFLVDGVQVKGASLALEVAGPVLDFWKKAAGLDVDDRRRRQTGKAKVQRHAGGMTDEFDLKIITLGSRSGQQITMEFDSAAAVDRQPDDLGLLDQQLADLKELAADGTGVVLLGSPSNNGRTTTLYSMLRLHDAYTMNLQTVEPEIEATIEGVAQMVFDKNQEASTFATMVRSQLRRDPDVLGVSDAPDADTFKEIARADHERTRVYANLKVDGAIQAIQAYLKAVGDANQASASLRGALGQRLLRKLCSNCRMPYQPAPEMLKKMGVSPDKVTQLYKKGGEVEIRNKPEICPVCKGVGYRGQVAAFEVFVFGPEERAAIAQGNFKALLSSMRKRGGATIQQAAIAAIIRGDTSVEELSRVLQPAPASKPGAPSASDTPASATT